MGRYVVSIFCGRTDDDNGKMRTKARQRSIHFVLEKLKQLERKSANPEHRNQIMNGFSFFIDIVGLLLLFFNYRAFCGSQCVFYVEVKFFFFMHLYSI